MRGFVVV